MTPRYGPRGAVLFAAAVLLGCSAADGTLEGPDPVEPAAEIDGPEPDDAATEPQALLVGSVEQAVSGSCSTTSVLGLSEQIVEQMNCMVPGALARLPERANLTRSAATFPYLQLDARDALVAALDANPDKTLSLNSMLRTVAQQYLLHRWAQAGRCGIALAATPGRSNHESGLALDTSQYSSWRSALESRGFKWFGSSDKVHFDHAGAGRLDLRGVDVKAFQMLWNANHPEDRIAEDGSYGPATGKRLAKSPAAGFPMGPACGSPPEPPGPPEPGSPDDGAPPGRALGVVWDLETASAPSAPGARRLGAATVVVAGGESKPVRSSDAYWELALAPGSYTITASAPGYAAASRVVEIRSGVDSWASIGLSPE